MIELGIQGPESGGENQEAAGIEALQLAGMSAEAIAGMTPVVEAINQVCQRRVAAAERAGRTRGAELMHETVLFVLKNRATEWRLSGAALPPGQGKQTRLNWWLGITDGLARIKRLLP